MWYIEMNGIEIWLKMRQIKEIPFGDNLMPHFARQIKEIPFGDT